MDKRSELAAKLAEARSALRDILAVAEADGDRSLTADEAKRFDDLEASIVRGKNALDRAEVADRQAEQSDKLAEARRKIGAGDGDPSVRVGHEERTYRQDGEHRFFLDMARAAAGDFEAAGRLQRHGHEQQVEARNANSTAAKVQARAGLTTSVGSGGTFLPPEYLLDEYIALPRPERVLADLVRQQVLPKGPMSIEIPKISSGTAVVAQTTENVDPQSGSPTDLADAYVSASVQTLVGKQTVSLQAVEQSSVPFDEIVFQDLERARDVALEAAVVAAVRAVSGINAISYTSSAPKGTEAYPVIGQAKSAVFKSIYRSATAILMTPDRWAWFETQSDTTGRPLVVSEDNGPYNSIGTVTGQMRPGPVSVGKLFGLPCFIAPQLPTNLGTNTDEDPILVLSGQDLILWESAPVARALPQTLGAELSVLLQTYEYYAFMPNRLPGAIADITGTGLIAPF